MKEQKQHLESTLLQQESGWALVGEKKSSNKTAGKESIKEKEKNNEDYWERIAEDPASGYKNENNDDPLLNIDQQPEDNKKGDQAP